MAEGWWGVGKAHRVLPRLSVGQEGVHHTIVFRYPELKVPCDIQVDVENVHKLRTEV